jgi:hypothetical protein
MNVAFVHSKPVNLHRSSFDPMGKTSVAAVESASCSIPLNEG